MIDCKYCKQEFGGPLEWEDHHLFACPKKCRDVEEEIKNLKKKNKALRNKIKEITIESDRLDPLAGYLGTPKNREEHE